MEQARIDQVPVNVLDTAAMHCQGRLAIVTFDGNYIVVSLYSVLQYLSQEINKKINLGGFSTSISTSVWCC